MTREQLLRLDEMMSYGKWVFATIAGFLSSIPELTWFLLALMVLDTIFGLAVAIKQRNLSSSLMWMGATKKLGSLGIIAMAGLFNRYANFMGMDFVQVSTAFYIGPEIISILRNAAILEVPIPPQFTQVLAYFNDKDRGKRDENKPIP